MLSHEQIVQFWQEVHDVLMREYGIDTSKSRAAVTDFMSIAEKRHFLDAVYHRNVEEIADTITGGKVSTMPKPAPNRKRRKVLVR